MPFSWFQQGSMRRFTAPNSIISLAEPIPTSWIVSEVTKEDDFQLSEEDFSPDAESFASVKSKCTNSQTTTTAIMRMRFKFMDATRASQASQAKSEELKAYMILRDNPDASEITPRLLAYEETTQSVDDPVPGGFMTFIVWSIVPGIRLDSPSVFWAMDSAE
ncbi:uncharacterized protein N7483_007273 [Penicillium malachiteum]|uniref:uncharacterized protein n=1 Tax=Penicillium malachiteum TaxID=1324776 RepID=UPI0025476DFE|nr:uncharacterized protein N7483_007273 [Penicillium malachiteum]KAJ5725916.1 hypothetical protein N7483_007273 [Penicillium malachiteum]